MHEKSMSLVLLLSLVVSGGTAWGDEGARRETSIDAVMDSLFRLQTLKEAVISPDGKTVAWVQTLAGKGTPDASHTEIMLPIGTPRPSRGGLPQEMGWAPMPSMA
jgi:hypothetical protein